MVLIKEIEVVNNDNTKKIVIKKTLLPIHKSRLNDFRARLSKKYSEKFKKKIRVNFIYLSL